MQNLNISNIKRKTFPESAGTIQAVHCDTFMCLLVKQEDATQTQSLYSIKQVIYNDIQIPKTIPIDVKDVETSDHFTSNLEYLRLINAVFFATCSGIFFVDFKTRKIKNMMQLPDDSSIVAAAWNSEQDSLAVVLNTGRVMVYCINYQTYELTMLAEDSPDNTVNHNVYLGWGDVKKQFKGKAVASYLKESHPPESEYQHVQYNGTIYWQYGERNFVVNTKNTNDHHIRIFDSECKLYHTVTSIKVPGMSTKTVFRSKHNTLATICQGNDGETYVVMHERNGEYYNTIHPFTPPDDKVNVDDIQFSTCGRIFAMLSHSQKEEKYFLDFYTQSNFTWLHKFRLTDDFASKPISFKFNPTFEDTYPIELIFGDSIIVYEFTKQLSATLSHTIYVNIANNLQEFDYKTCVIPPCGVHENILTTSEIINYVAVQVHKEKTTLVVVDSLEVAHVYHRDSETIAWKEIGKFDLKHYQNNNLPAYFYKFGLTTEYLIAVGFYNDENSMRLTIPLNKGPTKMKLVKNIHKSTVNPIEILHEEIYKIGLDTAFVLAQNGDFYINGEVILAGVTSLLNYNDNYLLLTQTSFDDPMDKLFCFDMSQNRQQQIKDDVNFFMKRYFSRRIEKGAILICMASTDGAVILEMPRGNIETVTVRPIILRSVHSKITAGQFLEAYNLVRRLAMKLDVLYDLAPGLFHLNIGTFVNSLGSDESVIKFLLPLKNISTLTSNDFCFVDEYPVEEKKNKICDALLEFYKLADVADTNLRVICIALLVKYDFNPCEALRFLVEYLGGVYTKSALLKLADVMNTLKIYCDAQEMYKYALNLYDVELVATIAQVAGMDPQVYRQFLQRCRESDHTMRRFLMADEGGNFKMAGLYMLLLYRKQEKNMEDVLEYAKDKDILEDIFKAMNKGDGEVLNRVSQLLSEKYLTQGLHLKAAEVFCKTGNEKRAIEVMTIGAALCWQEAVVLIGVAELSMEETHDCFAKLAEVCVSHGMYKEAACIYLEKCSSTGNVGKAVVCCLDGLLFKEIVTVLTNEKYECPDKDEYLSKLKEKLIGNLANIEANLVTRSKMFDTHYDRLKVVREDRKHRSESGLDGDDAYSEAGSVTTRSHSSYASTTTRRTRKLALKLRSLRHGGKFEDIALMRELYDIVSDVCNMAQDLFNLRSIYAEYAQIDTECISNEFEALQKKMADVANEIWPADFTMLNDDVLTADFLTENVVYLEKEFRYMPKCIKIENK